jgi:hypothetical protein
MEVGRMTRIVAGRRYDTNKAELVADDAYWDGSNMERHGRNTFLYRTAKGAFFAVHLTMWQGERDTLEPLTQEEALSLYEGALTEHHLSHAEAFPDVEVSDA